MTAGAEATRGQWLIDQKRHEERGPEPTALARPIDAEEVARFIVPHLLSGCAGGELSFADAVKRCVAAMQVDGLAEAKRQRLVGAAVEALLSVDPKATRSRLRDRPLWLCRACSELVDLVTQREGLPLAGTAPTAYERAAELLIARGLSGLSASIVTRARADWKLHANKP